MFISKEKLSRLYDRLGKLENRSYGKVALLEQGLRHRPTRHEIGERDKAYSVARARQDARIEDLEAQLRTAGELIDKLNVRFLELGGILARKKIVDQRRNHTKQRRAKDRRKGGALR